MIQSFVFIFIDFLHSYCECLTISCGHCQVDCLYSISPNIMSLLFNFPLFAYVWFVYLLCVLPGWQYLQTINTSHGSCNFLSDLLKFEFYKMEYNLLLKKK
eukprot:324176_1